MQARWRTGSLRNQARFSILIGSGGDASETRGAGRESSQCFSILIGSGGDASMRRRMKTQRGWGFSILIGSGGDARMKWTSPFWTRQWFQYPHRIGW